MSDNVMNTHHRAHRPARHRGGDSGAIAVTMLIIGMIVVLFAAALLGGATVFAAKAHGYDLVQSAARAGAQHIDITAYRTSGVLRLNPAEAVTAARQYLAAAGATGQVTATTASITVTATSTQPTPMLRPFDRTSVHVTATATAAPTTAGTP